MSQEQMPSGWYYAQGDPTGTTRYWDGSQWLGEPQTSTPGAPGTAEVDPTQRLIDAWPRIGGRVIDGLIWAVIGFVVNLPATISAIGESIDAVEEGREAVVDINPAFVIIGGLLNIALILAYEVFMNTKSSGTLGKRVISAKIVQADGSDLDTRSAVMRMALYAGIQLLGIVLTLAVNPQGTGASLLLGLPFWIIAIAGVIMLFTDGKKQTPWDKVGKTLVVQR